MGCSLPNIVFLGFFAFVAGFFLHALLFTNH